jgi:hypothetical protein
MSAKTLRHVTTLAALALGAFTARADFGAYDPATRLSSPKSALPDALVNPLNLDQTPPPAPTNPVGVPGPGGPRFKTYELPPVNVVGEKPSDLREEDRVGPYAQPRWTATRRFPNTRVYVIPEGKVEAELWFIPRFLKSGETNGRYLAEIEYGLPHRFQLDLYYRLDINNAGDGQNGAQFEVRWALADWGKIWGNPTIYAEYIYHEHDADAIEFKLLLGDELAPRWHWGVNFVAELETGGEREYVYEFDGGISYTLIDQKLSAGAETKVEFATTKGGRGDYETSVMVGPSIQWWPIPRLSVNFAPLLGVSEDAPTARVYLNLGWEF